MIERCLIIDTETNGTDLQMCNAIEFGAVLYSVKERAALGQVSFLDHWEVSAEIESITGITQRLLDEAKETRRQFYAQAYLVLGGSRGRGRLLRLAQRGIRQRIYGEVLRRL